MNEFAAYHTTLDNETLVRLAFFELRSTKKEARVSAKAELKQRAISEDELQRLKQEIRAAKRKERYQKRKNKNKKYGFWDFIFDVFLRG